MSSMKLNSLISLCLCVNVVVSVTYVDHCPSSCVCTVMNDEKDGNRISPIGTHANCQHSRFIQIPSVSQFPEDTYELDLSWNPLTTVHVFDSMKNLAILDLSDNQINRIVPFAFLDLKSLSSLDLSNNKISELNVETFDGLNGLKVLNLSHNLLTDLDDNLLKPFKLLQELYLSNNPLIHINSVLMKPLRSLSTLALNNIEAYALPSDVFRYNTELTELHLSANKFVKVPNDGLRSAVNLKKLIFNRNPIRQLDWQSFIGLSALEVLSISYSQQLTDVYKEAFGDLRNLRVLKMIWNEQLNYLDPLAFDGMFNGTWFKLEELYLNDNELTSIDEASLNWCQLKVLDLRSNNWRCDCYLKWIMQCANIHDILVTGVRCKSPPNLNGIDFRMLNESLFSCSLKFDPWMKSFSVSNGA